MEKFSTAFILVNPQMGENIGAAARAMLNFGLKDLRLVAPRDGWPNQAALDNGAGAFDILKCRVFKTLEEAAADVNYLYATTARPRYIVKPVYTSREAVRDVVKRSGARQKKNQKTAFVFGPERTGLTNDDIAFCHAILTIPSNEDFPCLNLAQSVSVTAYELFQNADKTAGRALKNAPAPSAKFEEAFARLETELEKNRFFESREIRPAMRRNIRAMLMRAEWSEQEIRTFHGIISALTGKKKLDRIKAKKKKAAR